MLSKTAGIQRPMVVTRCRKPSQTRVRALGFADSQCRTPGLLIPIRDAFGRTSSATVTVTTERQERSVSGTVYADGKPRLVDIKGIFRGDGAVEVIDSFHEKPDEDVVGELGVQIGVLATLLDGACVFGHGYIEKLQSNASSHPIPTLRGTEHATT